MAPKNNGKSKPNQKGTGRRAPPAKPVGSMRPARPPFPPLPRLRPKPPPKPKPKRKARVTHMLSPHCLINVPASMRCGKAFPYHGNVTVDITVPIGSTVIILGSNPGYYGTVFVYGIMAAGAYGPSSVPWAVGTITNMANGDTVGGPTSARAMKFGISLTNTTPQIDIGGRVAYFDCDQRIRVLEAPETTVGLSSDGFFTSLKGSLQVTQGIKNDNASTFEKTKEIYSHVVDHIRYEDFHEFNGTATVNDFFRAIGIWPSVNALDSKDRSMSTVGFIIQPTTKIQTYSIVGRAAWYTRWTNWTMQGQSSVNVPVASTGLLNSIHSHAESMAGVTHSANAVATGVANSLFPMLADAAIAYAKTGFA